MIRTGNKLYDWCPDCGNLVRLNKPFVGSMHFCVPSDVRRLGSARERRRKVIVEALKLLHLPEGKPDDEFCDGAECGVRIGKWVVYFGGIIYQNRPDRDGFTIFHDDNDFAEHIVCESTYNSKVLAAHLRRMLNKYDLWKSLKRGN